MSAPNVFAACRPRADVLSGQVSDADFAADLARVLDGSASDDYRIASRFFANTYPTRGLRNLLQSVCRRLSGAGGEAAAVLRLDTSFGGGKTHGLIALVHAANGMRDVDRPQEFIDPALLPRTRVRVGAFDGENADPANGRQIAPGVRAFTPWGELAYRLAGADGYERVRASDERCIAPGADTLRELFGDEPSLILLDELAIYLRKVRGLPGAQDQLSAFLTSLIKAIESTRNCALVFSLAVGKEGRSSDAYSDENEYLARQLAEAESIAARKATLLNPTDDDETAHVLRRRLFASIDETAAEQVIAAYQQLWRTHREALPRDAGDPGLIEEFRRCYPFHPEVLETLTRKTATLATFHRVRGMLRLLAKTIADLWAKHPADAHAIHLHHIDPGNEQIHQEIVTRLQQQALVPAIRSDVAAELGGRCLAGDLDRQFYSGLAPYATYVARSILFHTLAFNADLKGASADQLRFSLLSPSLDLSFVDDARSRFTLESAYLDDRPNTPIRFLHEPNLTQVIRRQEGMVDKEEARAALNDQIRQTFSGQWFDLVPYPGGEWDVGDDVGQGPPKLALLAFEGVSVSPTEPDAIPDIVTRIYTRKGSNQGVRILRNHLLFIVADHGHIENMRRKMDRRLALQELKKPERLRELPEHQQAKLRELESRSLHELAIAIQQCYRHVFYPSRARIAGTDLDLAHAVIENATASERPGAGQQQILSILRDVNKLRLAEDSPDSPTYVRDRTPLKRGQITTADLRNEFRKDAALPMLLSDEVFVKLIRRGVEMNEFVYRRGELLYGPGDPGAQIVIDEQSYVFTRRYAEEQHFWPRARPELSPTVPGGAAGGPAGTSTTPRPAPPMPPGTPTPSINAPFEAEGLLREALSRVFGLALAANVTRLRVLNVRFFEAGDFFRTIGAVNAIANAAKRVYLEAELETREGGIITLGLQGPVADAQIVRDFLLPQLNAARDKNLSQLAIEMRFETGLPVEGDEAQQFLDKFARFAAGSAFVQASATGE